ncbi:hypothetical protein [Mycolicibacterium sp. YH-1]|uniref:hypothetical protein n=1 Tax=Mycolicibacterium sp. YH-1 TaxID=2908837 RepID=UPI001F4BD3F6|nr:hypothetical protein [Mycolicibacterium sp. YH-1]UNB49925.1 hypothetical protein L0M16_18100 [Mycolicibacterium sp. YH-1]
MADRSDIEPHTEDNEGGSEHALAIDTVVVYERGRWAVDIIVVFADGIVRKRIDNHPTQARAELSARMIKRAAERDIRGPLNG